MVKLASRREAATRRCEAEALRSQVSSRVAFPKATACTYLSLEGFACDLCGWRGRHRRHCGCMPRMPTSRNVGRGAFALARPAASAAVNFGVGPGCAGTGEGVGARSPPACGCRQGPSWSRQRRRTSWSGRMLPSSAQRVVGSFRRCSRRWMERRPQHDAHMVLVLVVLVVLAAQGRPTGPPCTA